MIERRLRVAAILVVSGLIVELLTLYSARPTAFLLFVGLGGLLIAAGVVLYLWTLLKWLVPRGSEALVERKDPI